MTLSSASLTWRNSVTVGTDLNTKEPERYVHREIIICYLQTTKKVFNVITEACSQTYKVRQLFNLIWNRQISIQLWFNKPSNIHSTTYFLLSIVWCFHVTFPTLFSVAREVFPFWIFWSFVIKWNSNLRTACQGRTQEYLIAGSHVILQTFSASFSMYHLAYSIAMFCKQ